jgi:hypothetical protein
MEPEYQDVYKDLLQKNGGNLDNIFNTKMKNIEQETEAKLDKLIQTIGSHVSEILWEMVRVEIEDDPDMLKTLFKGMMKSFTFEFKDVPDRINLHYLKSQSDQQADSQELIYNLGVMLGQKMDETEIKNAYDNLFGQNDKSKQFITKMGLVKAR